MDTRPASPPWPVGVAGQFGQNLVGGDRWTHGFRMSLLQAAAGGLIGGLLGGGLELGAEVGWRTGGARR